MIWSNEMSLTCNGICPVDIGNIFVAWYHGSYCIFFSHSHLPANSKGPTGGHNTWEQLLWHVSSCWDLGLSSPASNSPESKVHGAKMGPIWDRQDCEVCCVGHHRHRGKTTTGSARDGAILHSNTGLSNTQYEQIPIIFGVWPFWLTHFFFRSITFWRVYV